MRTRYGFVARIAILLALALLAPAKGHATTLPDGATGINALWEQAKSGVWYIEQQRSGADKIVDGISKRSSSEIQSGIVMLNWGFAHQAADGSFAGTGTSAGDEFHSSSIFIEAAARATLLLSQYDAIAYKDTIAIYATHLRAEAYYMIRPSVAAIGQKYNARFTHRRYLLAAALGETAALIGDGGLANNAARYAGEGLALQLPNGWRAAITQNPDGTYPPATLLAPGATVPAGTVTLVDAGGVDPEEGGYDVNYQCVGLEEAAYFDLVCPPGVLQNLVRDAIVRGLIWESRFIDANGHVCEIGSTRMDQEATLEGATKHVNVTEIKNAYALGYQLTHYAPFYKYASIIK